LEQALGNRFPGFLTGEKGKSPREPHQRNLRPLLPGFTGVGFPLLEKSQKGKGKKVGEPRKGNSGTPPVFFPGGSGGKIPKFGGPMAPKLSWPILLAKIGSV